MVIRCWVVAVSLCQPLIVLVHLQCKDIRTLQVTCHT